VVTTIYIRFDFDCDSTARRPFDDLRHDRTRDAASGLVTENVMTNIDINLAHLESLAADRTSWRAYVVSQ